MPNNALKLSDTLDVVGNNWFIFAGYQNFVNCVIYIGGNLVILLILNIDNLI